MANEVEIPLKLSGLESIKAELKSLRQSIIEVGGEQAMLEFSKRAAELSLELDKANEQVAEMGKSSTFEKISKSVNDIKQDINSINFDKATKSMNDLSSATDEVARSMDKSATFAQRYGDELQPLTTRLGEAEDRLYELALAGDKTSQEYQDLLETVSRYRQVQIQTDQVVDGASQTMAQKLGGSIGGVTAGFELAQGAMGAFGVESEKLQETLLKVQSASAIAQGFQGIKEAIPSFKALGQSAKNALNGIKSGVAATGIGLLLVAVGTLVAYWDEIKEAVGGVSDEQEELNKQAEKNVNVQQSKLDALNGQDNVLKLQGKSEREIAQLKIKQLDALLIASEVQLEQQRNTKKAEVEATKRNFDILKLVTKVGIESSALALRLLIAPIDAVLETANAVSEALGFGKITTSNLNKEISKLTESASTALSKFIFDPDELAKESNETIKETKNSIEKIKNERAGLELSIKAIDEKALEDRKKNADEAAKLQEEAKKKELEITNQANQNRIAAENELNQKLEDVAEQNYLNSLSESDREIRLIQDKYFELETLAQGNAQALADIEIAKLNEINNINLKYQDIEAKAREDKKKADQEAAQKELEEAAAVAEQKAVIQQQGLDTAIQGVQLLKGLFEKSKGVQKASVIAESAIGIAKMVISNKVANAGALAKYSAIPGGAALAAVEIKLNNISTGIGVAANVAATAKALQALGGGSAPTPPSLGGGGSVGSSAGSSAVPSFVPGNLFGQNNAANNVGAPNDMEQGQNITVTAVVSETEMTATQNKVNKIMKNSVL
jgi:hypothetical protein